MEQEKIIVGLDIGSTKVLALVGKQNSHGRLELLGMGQAASEGVARGVITNLDKTVVAIKQAIKQAEESSGIDIRIVHVGIAGRHITSSMYHGSITREDTEEEITLEDVHRLTKDMYKILTPPGSQIIHVIPQSYTVDYEAGIKDPVGMAGIRLEADFHIITAATNAINNIYKCTQRAGLEVAELILEPLAASLATLSDEEKEAGVCLIDIGGGIVNIAIFHDGILRHTAIIPLGGHSITADIKVGLQVMEYQAELLKKQFGKAIVEETTPQEVISIPGLRNRPPKEVSLRHLAQIIEARVEEIIELVHNEIITSGFHNKLAAGIVITGGGSQLPSLKKLVEYVTGLDNRLGYPNDLVARDHLEEIKNPAYATGIGLVLAGFQESEASKESANRNNSKQSLKKEKQRQHFLKKFLHRTKGLLIDDYEEQSQ
jgi:cell division protein FtsA